MNKSGNGFKSGLKSDSIRCRIACGALWIFCAAWGAGAFAQQPAQTTHDAGESSSLPDAEHDLPDAPAAQMRTPARSSVSPTAPIFKKYIEPDQSAQSLSASEKVAFGFHDAFSPTSLLVWTLAAGYEQALNGSPNYTSGNESITFVKRVGASAIRDSSDGIFTAAVFAPIFHQDPRYYKVGPSRGPAYRVMYAITRPMITRTDGGHAAPNASLLAGDLFGSWLTNAYYPQINRGFDETAKTFGGSIGATALGNLVQEFLDDAIRFGHRKQ